MKAIVFRGLLVLFMAALMVAPAQGQITQELSEDQKYLMIRADDIGMSHSVNMALRELLETGYPVSASVMFPTPWYKEAVAILKAYDNVSVGIHLTLNSEWEYYRWGPITGREAVPSLVDEDGHFHHKTEPLKENPPSKEEMKKELRAQIERARKSGLRIDYMDYHMGIKGIPGFNEVLEELAEEYDLGMWGEYDTPRFADHYAVAPEAKAASLVSMVNNLSKGFNYIMTHVGIHNDELSAMKDMNSEGSLSLEMSEHRQGELTALTSGAFARALQENEVQLVTYKDLMETKGTVMK